MNIFVVGCGKIGAALAKRLSEAGHDVAVIDQREENFDNLPDDFGGLTFCGVPIDEDVLIKAGIRNCDVFCAASADDNRNIMAAQLAKTVFGVERVIARVSDSEKEEIFSASGIVTVCPTNLTVDSLLSAFGDYAEESLFRLKNHTFKMFSAPVPKELAGERALSISLEENEVLYAVVGAGGEIRLVNNYNFILNEGETLVFSKIVD